MSFLHYAGVPRAFVLTTSEHVRFEFLPTAVNLATAWDLDMQDYSFPAGWGRFWRIGDITYTQAAAWLCVEELTGRVVAIDVDIDDPVYLVNGSVEAMVRCMKAVRDWAAPAGGSLARAGRLEDAIARDPALADGEADHFWQPLVASAVDSGCDTLAVEYE
jgi:hypothetical protein